MSLVNGRRRAAASAVALTAALTTFAGLCAPALAQDKTAAEAAFVALYGHHPLGAWCDNTGEALALRLRPGNAGSNTAADHIAVLGEAIAQIPDPHRRDLLITVDGRAPPWS